VDLRAGPRRQLAQAAGVYTIGGESHQLIESIAALRPGRGVVRSNRLTRRDATSAIVAELRKRFGGRVHDRDGKPPPPGARVRLLEKTPKNALRVPFLLEVFPDAQFIFLQRERRANLSSMMQAWRAKGWITYRQLPGWPGPWSRSTSVVRWPSPPRPRTPPGPSPTPTTGRRRGRCWSSA